MRLRIVPTSLRRILLGTAMPAICDLKRRLHLTSDDDARIKPAGDGGARAFCTSQGLISSVTRAMPLNPRARAPAGVRSIIRPRTNGPRSFILTTTELPLLMLVTRTFVPKGRVRCAAVKAPDLTRSPFAVFGPLLAV